MIDLPKGLLASSQAYLPDVRRFYWIAGPLLDPGDPETERPAVVLSLPDETPGDIAIGMRSSTEKNGVFHSKQREEGLNKDGWFSRLRTRPTGLWTPDNARSIEFFLDEETFAYVCGDFLEVLGP